MMNSQTKLRNGECECIFCGERAMERDVPCNCFQATEERVLRKNADDAQRKVRDMFEVGEDFREKIEPDALQGLLGLCELLARGVYRSATVGVGGMNKAAMKRTAKGVDVKRIETMERKAEDDEEEPEE